MSDLKKIRIPVTTNEKVVTVDLKNNIDVLEILSLKFSQTDIYSSGLCSDYGVVAGRVSANNGLGIPNAKVSIFIPLSDSDEIDPVISSLYPYKIISDKDDNNYRYNLLPKRKQHGGHVPTGTFFDQEDILSEEQYLEVFEKYYNYTVKTNESGDFMIWGVPVGIQTIHIDIDLSDIGCFSLRPYDFIRKGVGEDKFDRFYNFKSSSDIDGLPQIVKFEKTIEVYPFIGNEELCEIGITRVDYDLTESDIKIEPVAILLASVITDDNSYAVTKNQKIKKGSGNKCNLITTEGKVESVRFTGGKVYGSDGQLFPELEYFNIPQTIDENGSVMVVLPMNIDYVYTNEFGEQEITSDKNKGIPTNNISRFRFSINDYGGDPTSAKYLVPNIREFNSSQYGTLNEYDQQMMLSYIFSDVFEDYLKIPDGYPGITDNVSNDVKEFKKNLILNYKEVNGVYELVPEDYFYKFTYGKVYTVSSFHGSYFDGSGRFLGVKEIKPNEDEDCSGNTNYFPINFAYKNKTSFKLLVSEFLLFISYVFALINNTIFELLGGFFRLMSNALYNIYFGWPFHWRPFSSVSEHFKNTSYNIQARGTQQLSLTTYPDCLDCTLDDNLVKPRQDLGGQYVSVGELKCKVWGIGNYYTENRNQVFLLPFEGRGINDETYLPGLYGQVNAADSGSTEQYYLTGFTENSLSGYTQTQIDKKLNYHRWIHTLVDSPEINVEGDEYNHTRFMAQITGFIDDSVETRSKYRGTRYDNTVYDFSANMGNHKSYTFNSFNISMTNIYNDYTSPVSKFTGADELSGSTTNQRYWTVRNMAESDKCGYGNQIFKWLETFGSFNQEDVDSRGYPISFPMFMGTNEWLLQTGVDYKQYSGYTYNSGATFYDRDLFVIVKVYDRLHVKEGATGTTITLEEGCDKYDTFYDDSLVKGYIVSNGGGYGDNYDPVNPPVNTSDVVEIDKTELEKYTNLGYTILSTVAGISTTDRLPRTKNYSFGKVNYDRKTKSGLTELRDGVLTVIPSINGGGKNKDVINEWYRRKRIGMNFCSGIINYSFTDNWLNGVLYFFKFRKRIVWDNEETLDLGQRTSKYFKKMVFFNILDQTLYYRSTPFNIDDGFIGQKFSTLMNSSYDRGLLHPTTFYDVGIRDDFFYEICSNPALDPNCSVVRDITSTSYQDPGGVVEYGLIYKMDISKKNNLDSFFNNSEGGVSLLDGDFTQLLSINSEVGIENIDLDSPHYFMFNNDYFDPESSSGLTYFQNGSGMYGPLQIDIKLDSNGKYIRKCLNYNLGDFSQVVPFYLWDKKGEGFGSFGLNSDSQHWDKKNVALMPLQRIYSINDVSTTVSNYVMSDGEEEYLLKPMTITHNTYSLTGDFGIDSIERFDYITASGVIPPAGNTMASGYTENELWLEVTSGTTSSPLIGNIYVVVNQTWVKQSQRYVYGQNETFIFQTVKNYNGNKQVLSTPFMFYFGLKPNKSSLDLLTKYYGPKGAFTPTD